MNLCEFPFALLGDSRKEQRSVLPFEDEFTGSNGQKVLRRWEVSSSGSFGLPNSWDEALYVILMEIAREQGFESTRVTFSRYEIAKRLGLEHKDQSIYRRIKLGLHRLASVYISADNAFYDAAHKSYITVGFHILTRIHLAEEERGRAIIKERRSFARWSDELYESFAKSDYIKDLDVSKYLSLRSAVARRLYRYLDKKRFDGKPVFEKEIYRLCHERIGLSRTLVYLSQLQAQMDRACTELKRAGVIASWDYEPMKTEPGKTKVVFRFAGKEEDSLAQRLIEQGMNVGAARYLSRHLPDECKRQLEYLPYQNTDKRLKNIGGFLTSAIKGNYPPPSSYLDMQSRKAKAEAAKLAEEVRLQKRENIRQLVLSHLSELSDEDRDRLYAEAESRLSPFYKHAQGRQILIDKHAQDIVLERLEMTDLKDCA